MSFAENLKLIRKERNLSQEAGFRSIVGGGEELVQRHLHVVLSIFRAPQIHDHVEAVLGRNGADALADAVDAVAHTDVDVRDDLAAGQGHVAGNLGLVEHGLEQLVRLVQIRKVLEALLGSLLSLRLKGGHTY